MTSRFPEQVFIESKANEYHLIFDLNGILVAIGFWVQPDLSQCFWNLGWKNFSPPVHATKFTLYIFSIMRRNFFKHLEIIRERFGIHLNSSRLVDQMLCLKNDHYSQEAQQAYYA